MAIDKGGEQLAQSRHSRPQLSRLAGCEVSPTAPTIAFQPLITASRVVR